MSKSHSKPGLKFCCESDSWFSQTVDTCICKFARIKPILDKNWLIDATEFWPHKTAIIAVTSGFEAFANLLNCYQMTLSGFINPFVQGYVCHYKKDNNFEY